MATGGGGAATNAGINFQHRIGALILAHLLIGIRNYSMFGVTDEIVVHEVRFETADLVDDLVLLTSTGMVLIQAKRTVALSKKIDSDFSKALRQFVQHEIAFPKNSDEFILAISNDSSKRIRVELRKITEALKLNETATASNPLTNSENEVLLTTQDLIRRHFKSIVKSTPGSDFLSALIKKIRVVPLDIESGSAGERAMLTLLDSKTSVSSSLLWGALIALCLDLAKDRLSIDNAALHQRMGAFIDGGTGELAADGNSAESIEEKYRGRFAFGKDVLLVARLLDDERMGLLELNRFENDGSRTCMFYDNYVELQNGTKHRLIHRTATMTGMTRFFSINKHLVAESGIIIVDSNRDLDGEANFFAKLHSERWKPFLQKAFNLSCINCGAPISEDSAPMIEIDERDRPAALGLSHVRCLSPMNRILGVIESELFKSKHDLRDFNYEQWFSLKSMGENVFCSTPHLGNIVAGVLWNPIHRSRAAGYCIKVTLDGGSAIYVRDRGKVERFSDEDAKLQTKAFNSLYCKAKIEKDPLCYTSESGTYGRYSELIKRKTRGDRLLRCVIAEAVPFTQSIGIAYGSACEYYAPLINLVSFDSGSQLSFNDKIFLVSEPMDLSDLLENWRLAGIEITSFKVEIIETDDRFDKFIYQCSVNGQQVIVDPMFDMHGELLSGFIIDNIEEFKASFQN